MCREVEGGDKRPVARRVGLEHPLAENQRARLAAVHLGPVFKTRISGTHLYLSSASNLHLGPAGTWVGMDTARLTSTIAGAIDS